MVAFLIFSSSMLNIAVISRWKWRTLMRRETRDDDGFCKIVLGFQPALSNAASFKKYEIFACEIRTIMTFSTFRLYTISYVLVHESAFTSRCKKESEFNKYDILCPMTHALTFDKCRALFNTSTHPHLMLSPPLCLSGPSSKEFFFFCCKK